MARAPKEYTVICHHRGRAHEYTGTLQYLIEDVFSYTLECGASWQNHTGCRKVNRNPKSGKGLVTALNNAAHNTMGSCFDPDWYELKEG